MMLMQFNDGRGSAEHWSREGKRAVKRPRRTCHDFAVNQVRLHRRSGAD
jgi:hypothetical protein